MLKLINIKKDDNQIEADFIPEKSLERGHAFYSPDSDKWGYDVPPDFDAEYGRMAVNGLKRIIKELQADSNKKIPNERLVMWY